MSEHVRDLDDATKLRDLGAPLDDVGARFRSRALAAEARADMLAASLDEANAARHGTIDKLNAAVLARKAAEAECARLRARLEEATELLRYMDYEDAPCCLDHHGYCQEHPGGFREVDGKTECWIAAQRAFLAAGDS